MKVLPMLLLLRHELFVECAEVARLTASIGCFKSACLSVRTDRHPSCLVLKVVKQNIAHKTPVSHNPPICRFTADTNLTDPQQTDT